MIGMDTRKAATEYRLAQWAQTLEARQESGQSIEAFCEVSGISRNTYFYWQRKLREAACRDLANRSDAGNVVPRGWARLTTGEAKTAAEGIAIEVGGCRILATEETDPELLAKVCRVLKAL